MKIVKIPRKVTEKQVLKSPVITRITAEEKIQFAKELKENPTPSEKIVLNELKKSGYVFQFQPVLYGYIPDFYFPREKCMVELDGRFHDREKDIIRDANLRKHGIKTLRIGSREVFRNLDWVMSKIKHFVKPKKKKRKKVRYTDLAPSEEYLQFLMKVADE